MEKQFAYGKTIQLWKNNSPMEKKFAHGKKIRLWKKKFAYGKTIQLWKNNSPVEKLFDYGRTIRQCENNLIFGKQFDYKNKFDYLKKSEIDFCIHGHPWRFQSKIDDVESIL